MPSDPTPRTGYVVKVYPRFSETFVVTEILAREEAGERLGIYALRPTTDARFHPEIARVQAPVTHLPRARRLTDGWDVLTAAQRELPGFAERFAALLPFLALVEATDVTQGLELARAVRRDGITHLHAHFATSAARVAHIAATLTGIGYSVTTHAKDLFHESVDPELLERLLAGAEHVVAISEHNRRHLERTFPAVAGRVRLVRNGLDLDRFPYADPAPVRGPLRVAAVGRLVEKKGFGLLVEAVRRARQDGLEAQVRIAGDGELAEQLARQVRDSGLEGTVELLGPRSQVEVRELLGWADVMAAPCVVGADGNADGLPTVLLEAMASGVPCVSTAVTGIPEAVHPAGPDGPATGLLLEPGDVPALARALQDTARPDFPRVEIARAARRLIEEEFDTRRQSRMLAALEAAAPAGA